MFWNLVNPGYGPIALNEGVGASPMLPFNNLIGWVGDSRIAQGYATASPSAIVFENNGLQYFGPALADGRARTRIGDSLATSGDNSDDIVADVATLIAAGVSIIAILVGINDRATQNTAWTMGNIEDALDLCEAASVVALICNEMPVDFLAGTEATDHIAVHFALDALHDPTRGRYVIDTWGATESSPGSNAPMAGVYRAEVNAKHPSTMGAFRAAYYAFAPVLREILPIDPEALPSSASDPRLLSTNPFMTGAVAVASAGGSGVLATDFSFLRASGANGIAVDMSKETLDDGNEWQKYVFSGTPAGSAAVDLARQQNLQAGLGASEYPEAVVKMRLSTDFANIRSVKSGVRIIGAADNTHTSGDETSTATDVLPAFPEVVEMVVRSPRPANPGSLTNLVLRPLMYPTAGVVAAGTMWIGCCALIGYDVP